MFEQFLDVSFLLHRKTHVYKLLFKLLCLLAFLGALAHFLVLQSFLMSLIWDVPGLHFWTLGICAAQREKHRSPYAPLPFDPLFRLGSKLQTFVTNTVMLWSINSVF